MQRLPLVAALAAIVFLDVSAQSGIMGKHVLNIQPLGKELPNEDLAFVKQALVGIYNVQIRVLPRVDLPEQAYYEPRRRYRAEKILPFLLEKLPSDGDRILGLTGVDISTDNGRIKDWGILGLATWEERSASFPLFAVTSERGKAPMRAFFWQRLPCMRSVTRWASITAPREDASWKMPGGLVRTCDREYDLCPRCRSMLRASGYTIPDRPVIPWPRP